MSAPEPVPDLIAVFQEVIETLKDHSIEYMVVGSVASIVYGEPRLTKGMDLVIELAPADTRRIQRIFPAEKYYCPPVEIVTLREFSLLVRPRFRPPPLFVF